MILVIPYTIVDAMIGKNTLKAEIPNGVLHARMPSVHFSKNYFGFI